MTNGNWRPTFSAALYIGALQLLAMPNSALSQDIGVADTEVEEQPAEIIVTSLRRSESLRNVPGALNVFDRENIRKSGIRNLRDVADRTPNFGMLDNYRPGLERFQLRGIITPQVGDPPLAFVIDGITAPDPEFATEQLFDLERVEVLRGAQGALYGRSAIGGTVNIITRAPGDNLEYSGSAELQSGDTSRVQMIVSGPLADGKIRGRIGGYRLEGDGMITNTFLDRGADFRDEYGITGQVTTDLSSNSTLDIRARYSNARSGIGYYDAVEANQNSIENFLIDTTQNVPGINRRESYYISSKFEQQFAFATLLLAGGYFHAVDRGVADGDLIALPSDGVSFFPSSQSSVDDLDAWTAELRLTSKRNGPLNWAVGSYFLDREKFSSFSVYDDPVGTGVLSEQDVINSPLLFSIQDIARSRTVALSGELSYQFSPVFSLTVAGRYDHDRRSSVDPRDPRTTAADASFDKFQPKLTAAYHPDSSLLLYASYSRGFRSGGFNQYSPVVPRSYPAETTDSYEAGAKLSEPAGVLSLNIAVFRNEQTNAQITRFNSQTFTLENVPIDKVHSQGLEMEATARIPKGPRVNFSGGYTDSDIRKFSVSPSAEGASMPYVPEFTASISVDHEIPINAHTELWFYAGYRLLGERSFSLDFPDLKSETHGFADLRAGLDLGHWELTAFAENLFNERQPEDVFAVFNGEVDLARQPNMPRRLGLKLRYSTY